MMNSWIIWLNPKILTDTNTIKASRMSWMTTASPETLTIHGLLMPQNNSQQLDSRCHLQGWVWPWWVSTETIWERQVLCCSLCPPLTSDSCGREEIRKMRVVISWESKERYRQCNCSISINFQCKLNMSKQMRQTFKIWGSPT